MGLLDSIFGKKPTKTEIAAYNYYLFFDYIPKRLHDWEHNHASLQSALTYSSLVDKNKVWKSLIKDTTITDSTLKKCNDVTLYLIKSPSNEMMGEVAMAIIAVNPAMRKYEYYTMEYSLGGFAICTADKDGNHYYMDECKDGEQFGAYVIKAAMETLIPAPKPKQQPQPKPQTKPQPASSAPSPKQHTADSFLKTLEKIADQYYKERGVVSLEDWMVTQKVGDSFKFYITQYPDAEFEDPNCEVILMVEFMDRNGRMEIVNKFFPNNVLSNPSAPKGLESEMPKTTPEYSSALSDRYYSLEQLRQIPMGGLRLQPIDAGIVFDKQQQEIVSLFAEKSPRIKKFLPNLDLSSPEAVQKYFSIFCQKTEMQLEFGYSIKMNKYGDQGYMGFIFVHTPLLNQVAINFPQWTIDFCIFEAFEGKRFMRTPLRHVLLMLKNELKVENVFAIVDEDNKQCLDFMKSLPFKLQPECLTEPTTGKKAKLFMCPLSQIEINFKRQS